MPPVFVIGIGGGSASGKTLLARAWTAQAPLPTVLLPLDRYYRDLSSLPLPERERVNFDHPQALDIDAYVQDLQRLAAQKPIHAPLYDFHTHTRTGSEWMAPQSLILAEGLLILALDPIFELLDFYVFLDAPVSVRRERKIERDMRERARSREYAARQFDETVQPMFEQWVLPSLHRADLVLDGAQPVEELADVLGHAIQKILQPPETAEKADRRPHEGIT